MDRRLVPFRVGRQLCLKRRLEKLEEELNKEQISLLVLDKFHLRKRFL